MPRRRRYEPSLAIPTPLLVGGCVAALALFAFEQFEQSPLLMLGVLVSAIVTLVIGGWWWWRKLLHQIARTRALQITDVDQMSGVEFEQYVALLLKNQGYRNVETTRLQGDFGADLIFRDRKGVKWAAQLKRYKGQVGVEALYQVLGGKQYYGCQRMMVVTNSNFSTAAINLALKSSIYLVYRERLIEWMVDFQQDKKSK
jgi:restriction system protein